MKNKRIWDMSPAELEQIVKDSGVSLYGNFKKIGKPKLKKLLPGKYDVDYTFSSGWDIDWRVGKMENVCIIENITAEAVPETDQAQDVHVDADQVPDVEWRGLCALILPMIRSYYGLEG